MEVFGACVLIREKRSFAPTLLEHVKAGRLYDAAERALPGLASDIKRLNETAHPGPHAIYAGHKMVDVNANHAEFTYGLVSLTQQEALEGVTVLANMAYYIVEKFRSIASDTAGLNESKIIMKASGAAPGGSCLLYTSRCV